MVAYRSHKPVETVQFCCSPPLKIKIIIIIIWQHIEWKQSLLLGIIIEQENLREWGRYIGVIDENVFINLALECLDLRNFIKI